jgi:hypothetical protein
MGHFGVSRYEVMLVLSFDFISFCKRMGTGKHKWNVKFLPFSIIQKLHNFILSFHIVNQSVRRKAFHDCRSQAQLFKLGFPRPQNTNHSFPKNLFQLQVIFQILIQNQTFQCLCITDTQLNPVAYAISSSCGSKVHDTSSIIFSSLLNIAFSTS